MNAQTPPTNATNTQNATNTNVLKNSVRNLQEIFKNIEIKYLVMVSFCLFVAIFFYYANQNPNALFSKPYLYSMMILLPLFAMVYLYFRFESVRKNISPEHNQMIYAFIGVIFTITLIIVLSFFQTKPLSKNSVIISTYVINIFVFAIIVVGLSIMYNVFSNSLRKLKGWTGFIINLIFFIPCLFSDFIEYLLSEFKNTPNVVYILFMLEIVFILGYLYIPKFLNKLVLKNGTSIHREIIYLNRSRQISNNAMFLLPYSVTNSEIDSSVSANPDVSGNLFNTNFGLSMWINTIHMNLGDTASSKMIFNYNTAEKGTPYNKQGKPAILFMGNDQFKFVFSENQKDTANYILKIPSQTWNYIVFNYHDNQVDLFVNGNLERSMDLTSFPIQQKPTDTIQVGDNNGIDGAICNIMYYEKPMTLTQITQSYNLLYNKNPPVNNLY